MLGNKWHVFTWLHVRFGTGNCYFCWSFWLGWILSAIILLCDHTPSFEWSKALPIFWTYIFKPAICISVISTFLTRIIIPDENY